MNAAWKWLAARMTSLTWSSVIKVVVVVFAVETAIFSYGYVNRTSPVRVVETRLPAVAPSPPRFLYNIYGAFGESALKKAMGVLVAGRRVYVSDSDNHRVMVFDYDGKPLFSFGEPGTGPGELDFPYGLAADAQGQIYVADMNGGAVKVYTPDGRFVRFFAEENAADRAIERPAGLTIAGGRVYLTDLAKHQVLVFNGDGSPVLSFGKPGTGDGEFRSPNTLAVAGNRIYVVDTGNDRVQVFDSNGKYQSQFNGAGGPNAPSALINPRGISVDARGVIYVVSNLTNLIHAFNQAGQKLFTFGGPGRDDEKFSLPNGMWIDDQGRLYITDVVNRRVAVFEL